MPRKRNAPEQSRASEGAPAEQRAAGEALAKYREMRDFERTPEPAPPPEAQPRRGPLTFVVQKHDATRLHYDVRLEIDGTMPSWPVPKGPSLDPKERRLAIQTEDHPLDYASFEGVIPRGEYGAGEVIVWDRGTYSPDEDSTGARDVYSFDDPDEANRRMREAVASGKVSVTFRGHRLKGSFALVKTQQAENSWLMIKHRDAAATADRDLTAEESSVLSGLTIEDLKRGRIPDRARPTTPAAIEDLDGARLAPFPAGLQPMQAALGATPFDDDRWWFEPKLDGIRVLAFVRDGEVTLRTRRGLDVTAVYPGVAEAFRRQPVASAVFDGEIVAFDAQGRPSFEVLQQRMGLQGPDEIRRAESAVPVVCFVFDLPYLDGFDLTRTPLWQRKTTLARVLLPGPRVHLLDHFEGAGEAAYDASVGLGFEGVVAKERVSPYQPGKRSARWLKLKHRVSGDFVIGGFSRGQGGRAPTFGSLLLGVYEEAGGGDPGALRFAGSVGSGFDDASLRAVRERLDALVTDQSPFSGPLPQSQATAAGVTFVRPELVAEVAFAQWTSEGYLRAPVFVRLRDDKSPTEVRREEPVAGAPSPPPRSGRVVSPRGRVAQAQREDLEAPPADVGVQSVLAQLESAGEETTLVVDGVSVGVSNLDKVMWPETKEQRALTKRDLLIYYARASELLIRHLRDRPLTLTRYPNGLDGGSFYQKHFDDAPPFVERVLVHSETAGEAQPHLLCNNLPTLLWLGQLADIALHSSLARVNPAPDGHHLGTDFATSRETLEASLLNYPDVLLFDLDPYIYAGTERAGEEPELNRRAWAATCDVAFWLKEILDRLGLSAFLKTSGATGLHIYVPIARTLNYQEVRSVAETIGDFLLRSHRREVTTEWTVERRRGKVFVDVNQNARIKNLAAPYSPRAKPGAPVSTPLRWDELNRVYPTQFTLLTVCDRLDAVGDLWESMLEAKRDLGALLGN